MIIYTKAHPRVGLIGNPSDGYFGKTISFTFTNFSAEVALYETPELEILPSIRDQSLFKSIHGLSEDVRLYGYYGGIRLLKATVKRFHDYCKKKKITLDDRNFTIRYKSDIPHRVGLAGSSAIITACLRALMKFYKVDIPKPIQANLILSVEKDELKIPAGLQDRVVQVYEGLVYMDFNKSQIEKRDYGTYEPVNPDLLPLLYMAYNSNLSEGTEIFHNNIRNRFEKGDKKIINAITFWARITDQARRLLTDNKMKMEIKTEKLAELLDQNFDMRKSIYKISSKNIEMIMIARSIGASAKFTGSGGAIVGTYKDDEMYAQMKKEFTKSNIKIIKPEII